MKTFVPQANRKSIVTFGGGERGQFFLPFEKVDVEKRLVWGIAQVEGSPDSQGDVVDYDASKKAFANWSGNIREMHTAKAVGRCVKVVFDDLKKRIYVCVHVSQGAEDTWKKVLDGTLRGFSIGGAVVSAMKKLSAAGQKFRRVTGYVLNELSLVDSPANASCLITAVEKRGTTLVPLAQVLGIVPEEKPLMRKRISSLNDLIKSAKTGTEEFLLVKRGDLKVVDGKFMLPADAPAVKLTKDEFAGDGYGMEGEADGPGMEAQGQGAADMEPHLSGLAKCHYGMTKAAGMDPDAHYAEATAEDRAAEDAAAGGAAAGGAGAEQQPAPIQAGRGLITTVAAQAMVKRAVDAATNDLNAKLADVTTALEAIKKGNGGTIIARKGGEGTVGELLAKNGGANEGAIDDDVTRALNKCKKIHQERRDLLEKQSGGVALNSQEQIRKGRISDDYNVAIEQYKLLTDRYPSKDELEAPIAA